MSRSRCSVAPARFILVGLEGKTRGSCPRGDARVWENTHFLEGHWLCTPQHLNWQRPQHNVSPPAPFCRDPGAQGYKPHRPDLHPLLHSIFSAWVDSAIAGEHWVTTSAAVVAVHMVWVLYMLVEKAKSALVLKSTRFYRKSGNYGPVISARAGDAL